MVDGFNTLSLGKRLELAQDLVTALRYLSLRTGDEFVEGLLELLDVLKEDLGVPLDVAYSSEPDDMLGLPTFLEGDEE